MKSNAIKLICSVLALSGFISQAGCSSAPKAQIARDNQEVQNKFEEANQLLDNKRYEDAAKAYDRLRVDKPVNQLDYFILLNAGVAYQSMGDCITAGERYRQVIRVTNNKAPETQALARLRLSEMLTCQGQDKLAIVNLVELYRNKRFLPTESADAEIPARLAAAYAREGNKKLADRYFKEAEMGYRKIIGKNMSEKQKPLLAKTLYYMGNMSHINPEKMTGNDYYTTVQSLQGYLYRALEIGAENWSELAAVQLEDAYKNVWVYLDKPAPAGSDDIQQREFESEKRDVANQALVALRQLYREKTPGSAQKPATNSVMTTLNKTEKQIQNFLATNRVGTSLTEEAKKAGALRQDLPKKEKKK
ncbi:MAG: hypothetical protein AABZ31_03810 [Bdellovibrionota bacterium]